jgi:type VI secretion system FHA domain protein
MLEVVAETYNERTPLDRVAIRLPVDGGTVGRGVDNTVVLSDPQLTISRRHLQFARAANGDYEVANVSARNYVEVNKRNLEPGARCVIRDQDRIRIGGYVLKIREIGNDVAGEAAPVPPPPGAQALRVSEPIADDFLGDACATVLHAGSSTSLFEGGADADPDEVLEATCSGPRCTDPMRAMNEHGIELTALSGKRDELVSGPPMARTVDNLLSDPLTERYRNRPAEGCADPLEMFGEAGESVFAGLGLFGDDGASGGDESHHINHRIELNTPFTVPLAQAAPSSRPAANPPPTIIPDDDFALHPAERAAPLPLEEHPTQEGRVVDLDDFVVHAPSSQRGNVPTGRDPSAAVDDQPHAWLGANTASASAQMVQVGTECETASTVEAICMAPVPRDATGVPPPHAHQHVPDAPPVQSAASDHSRAQAELFHALLDGLGLTSLPDRDHLDPEFMRLLGRLLRVGTQGTIDLISARAAVKREVRANVTVIAPERNNPLKFSPDSEVGLMYLLGRPYPGFMAPVEAMREAYADLYSHQMGIVSGMRSALGHVLERFDPETIATTAQRNGLIEGLLAVGHKARLWDAYGRYFQNTREQAEDRFQDFFGAVFLDAYDEVAGSRDGCAARRKTGGD